MPVALSWYRTGTVSVTNGSPNIVGVGTLWLLNSKPGDIFVGPDLAFYEITGVTDDTHAAVKTLAGAAEYAGATLSGQSYAIIRNFTNTTNADLASRLAWAISSFQGYFDEKIDWLAGTVGGGPNSDGTYPLTDTLGNTVYVKCPAQMEADHAAYLPALAGVSDTGKTLAVNAAGDGYDLKTAQEQRDNLDLFSKTDLTKAIGNITDPMTWLPLTGEDDAILLKGDFQFLREDVAAVTTYKDRYGVLQKTTYYSGTPTSASNFSVTDTSKTFGDLKGYVAYLTDGSNIAYRWVADNTTTASLFAKPIGFVPTSYKLSKPRFEQQGLLIEGASTNYIRNNTMQGAVAGTPGTMPTNWGDSFYGNGISREIVGTGTENGIDYIDVRYYGTSTDSALRTIRPDSLFTQLPASVGDVITLSAWAKIAAGSMTGFSSFVFRQAQYDSTPTSLGSTIGTDHLSSLTTSFQRLSDTSTLSAVGTAYSVGEIRSSIPSGVAVDVTIRIGLPQNEKLPFASSVIPTTSAAVTRAADPGAPTGANNCPGKDITILVDVTPLANGNSYATGDIRLFGTADSRGSNYRLRTIGVTSGYNYYPYSEGGGYFTLPQAAFSARVTARWGFRLEQDGGSINWATFKDGIKVASGTVAGTLDHSRDGIVFGKWLNAVFSANYRNARVIDAALSDADMRVA